MNGGLRWRPFSECKQTLTSRPEAEGCSNAHWYIVLMIVPGPGSPLPAFSGTLITQKMPQTSIPAVSDPITLLSDQDLYLFNEGSNYRMYETIGAHLVSRDGKAGAVFSVWAPNASQVSVIGSFNDWNTKSRQLVPRGDSGIWEGFIPAVTKGALYKFHIEARRQ